MPSRRKKTKFAAQMTEDLRHVRSLLGSFLVLCVFVIQPLAINHGYTDITQTKQNVFVTFVVLSAVALGIVTLLGAASVPGYFHWTGVRGLLRAVRPYEYALLAYWLVMLLSTLGAGDRKIALFGGTSRNEGLLVMTVYAAAAAIVGRCYRPKRRDLLIFCGMAALVAAYGLCQSYGFDFLGFDPGSYSFGSPPGFIATMSNRNVASAYFCLAFCIAAVLFTQGGKEREDRFPSYLCLGICWILFYILILGVTSSGYVGLFVSFAILFPMIARGRGMGARFFLLMAGCLFFLWFTSALVHMARPGMSTTWDALAGYALVGAVALAAGAALLRFLPSLPDSLPEKPFRIGWYLLLAVMMAVGLLMLPVLARLTASSTLQDAAEILKGNFPDSLGSGRLFIWKRAITMVPERFFLGHGPDNFLPDFEARFALERQAGGYPRFDKAHNEYLQVLFDLGVLGLLAQLSFFVLVLKSAAKRLREPMVLAVTLALSCFMVQSFFNIFSPFAHPIAWVLWGVLAAMAYRESEAATGK